MAWETRYEPVQLAEVAYAALKDEAQAAIAVAVALAESGGRMTVNRSAAETPQSLTGVDRCVSVGPWQINYCPTRDRGTIRERAANSPALALHASAMATVHAQQGWNAWTMYANGTWQRHRAEALEAVKQARLRAGVGTDDSFGAAAGEVAGDAAGAVAGGIFGQWAALASVLSNPRRLGYLALGTALAIVALVLIVKESTGGLGGIAGLIPHPAAQAAAAVTGD